ncbi:MAG: pentapeptide repeat-containing protein [Dehalococcoidia bacterium]
MNKNHLEIILTSNFKDLEDWHNKNQYQELDLRGAIFSNKDFAKFDFSRSLLDHATFVNCNLDETIFNSVKFRNGFLENISAKKSIFNRTNFFNITIKNVDFSGAKFYRCVFTDAKIENINLKSTALYKVSWPSDFNHLA